jgi:hypothetical protein
MTTIRPSRNTILVFGALSLIVLVLGISQLYSSRWGILLFLVPSVAVLTFPIYGYAVWWDQDTLGYRKLLTTKRIRLSEVRKFKTRKLWPKRWGLPVFGLYIWLNEDAEAAIAINIKPFSPADLAMLQDRLKLARDKRI